MVALVGVLGASSKDCVVDCNTISTCMHHDFWCSVFFGGSSMHCLLLSVEIKIFRRRNDYSTRDLVEILCKLYGPNTHKSTLSVVERFGVQSKL